VRDNEKRENLGVAKIKRNRLWSRLRRWKEEDGKKKCQDSRQYRAKRIEKKTHMWGEKNTFVVRLKTNIDDLKKNDYKRKTEKRARLLLHGCPTAAGLGQEPSERAHQHATKKKMINLNKPELKCAIPEKDYQFGGGRKGEKRGVMPQKSIGRPSIFREGG